MTAAAQRVELRVATKEDLYRWYKGPPPVSMRAFVAEKEGELLAVWGIQFTGGLPVCFSTIHKAARMDKRAVVEGVRMLRKLLQQYPYVVTFASKDEPTSEGFIRHVGFSHVSPSDQGEVYVWAKPQSL